MRTLIRAKLIALAVSLSLATPVMAGPLEEIDAANRNGDYATALRLLLPLAEQGNGAAQDRLGLMYYAGAGVVEDYAEAEKWFRKGADQGDADAQSNLGRMYWNGTGVPQDYVQAHKWFNLAAVRSQGAIHEDAVNSRDAVAAKMTPDQIAEAQKLASEWAPK
jgi:hypothetical protein